MNANELQPEDYIIITVGPTWKANGWAADRSEEYEDRSDLGKVLTIIKNLGGGIVVVELKNWEGKVKRELRDLNRVQWRQISAEAVKCLNETGEEEVDDEAQN